MRQKRYRIVARPEQADYVFLAEASFWPVLNADLRRTREQEADRQVSASGTGRLPVPDLYLRAGVDDAHPDTMESIVAVALPVNAYQRFADDSVALLNAKVWEGANIGVSGQNASPEDLVLQLLGRPLRSDDGQPPRSDADRDLARMRQRALRDHPEWFRLDGRSVCSRPQPPLASEMVPEEELSARSTLPSAKDDAKGLGRPTSFGAAVTPMAVPVVVTTAAGEFVGGLTISDFRLFENEVEQVIERVGGEAQPITAVLLIDVSGSLGPRRNETQVAAAAFIDQLRAEDRALVTAFDSRTWLVADVTSDKRTLRAAILRLRRSGLLTKLYDALEVVTVERLAKIGGRRALILLTDGMDTASQVATASAALATVEAAGVPVYAVQFDTTGTAPRPQPAMGQVRSMPRGYFDSITPFEHGGEYLQQLARTSGGTYSGASDVEGVVSAFRRAVDDLRSQYTLYYVPSNQLQNRTFRRVQVVVNRPGLTVHARREYFAGNGSR